MKTSRTAEKIFCLGLNKTGTGSLTRALTMLGYRCKGWDPKVFNSFAKGSYIELRKTIGEYDAFLDWPWPLLAEFLIESYAEGSRFILTKRSSAESWYRSLARHADLAARNPRVRKFVFGYNHPKEEPDLHMRFYIDHLQRIRKLISEHGLEDQFLELCIEGGDQWYQLCSFLECTPPEAPFPHANRGLSRDA